MKAMLFAAGLGTRLRPLTDHLPKALVQVNGKPLLQLAIERLKLAGCRSIIVNVHHFAEQVVGFLDANGHFGIQIAISDESSLLLDTGGGLKKAQWFFEDGQPFLVCNADVLTNMDLAKFYQHHARSGRIATLAVRQRPTSRYFLFDENMRLKGWQNAKTAEIKYCTTAGMPGDQALSPWAFSGIHAVSPTIFHYMPQDGPFSIVDTYLQIAASEPVVGYPHNDDQWLDVGRPETLELATKLF